MGGETKSSISSWTTDTLKEYIDRRIDELEYRLVAADTSSEKANQQRFDAQQQGVKDALTAQKEAVAAALVAAEKAVLVAETNAEKWRMNANEWRGSMLDREAKFASRVEVEAKFETLNATIASLKETRAEGIGSKSALMLLLGLIAAAGTIAAIIFAFKQ